MAKLSELMKIATAAFGDPEASVKVIAAELRKAKMISSGGRGLHGADMIARDGANLTIGLLIPGNATDSAKNTVRIRDAVLIRITKNADCVFYAGDWTRNVKVPRLRFMRALSIPHAFGDAIDALMQDYIDFGIVEWLEDDRMPMEDIRLRIIRTAINWDAEISLRNREHEEWTFRYNVSDEEFDYVPRADWNKLAAELITARGQKKLTFEINDRALGQLTDCLRGNALPDDEEDHDTS